MTVSRSLPSRRSALRSLQLLKLGRGLMTNTQLEVRSDISASAMLAPELTQEFQRIRDQISSLDAEFSNSERSSSIAIFDIIIERRPMLRVIKESLSMSIIYNNFACY